MSLLFSHGFFSGIIPGMKKFFSWLLSIFVWLFVAVDTLGAFLTIALLKPFDPDQKISYRVANLWGRLIVQSNPMWKVKISGRSHIKKNKGYVLVANHSSLADIVILYCLGKHFKWISKESLFKIPFFGWTMSLLRYISLRRGEHGSIRDTLREAQEWLEKDISVLIFPEGTRSRTGDLGEFKNGAFKIAIRTGKPLIPIVITGTNKAISKGEAMMTAKVEGSIKVLPAIDVSSYKPEDYKILKANVRELMEKELASLS